MSHHDPDKFGGGGAGAVGLLAAFLVFGQIAFVAVVAIGIAISVVAAIALVIAGLYLVIWAIVFTIRNWEHTKFYYILHGKKW